MSGIVHLTPYSVIAMRSQVSGRNPGMEGSILGLWALHGGIELLRDGDQLAEHCNGSSTTGAYHRWIANGWIKDWIILDCVHSRPQKYRMIALFLPLGPHS